jgi:hypothetical protein
MDKCSESAAAVVPVVPSLRSLCGAMNRVLGSCSLGATYIAVPIKIERGAVGEYWGGGGWWSGEGRITVAGERTKLAL